MVYTVNGKNFSAGIVADEDVVKLATGNFRWACGQRIGHVLEWASQRGLHWSSAPMVPPGLALFDSPKEDAPQPYRDRK